MIRAPIAAWIATSNICLGISSRNFSTSALPRADRKSTRLNSSHQINSYAVFCLQKARRADRGPCRHDYGAGFGGTSLACRRLKRPHRRQGLSWLFFDMDTAPPELDTQARHDRLADG